MWAKLVPKWLPKIWRRSRNALKHTCTYWNHSWRNLTLEKIITYDEVQFGNKDNRCTIKLLIRQEWRRKEKERTSKLKMKIMIEWIPEDQTVKLREWVRKKGSELRKSNAWILHQDNASAHNALPVEPFLAGKKIPVMDHPLYSPDLAPCDFYLFPKVKSALKRTLFQTVDEVKEKTATLLKRLTHLR